MYTAPAARGSRARQPPTVAGNEPRVEADASPSGARHPPLSQRLTALRVLPRAILPTRLQTPRNHRLRRVHDPGQPKAGAPERWTSRGRRCIMLPYPSWER
jgi:hypothetical protein